MTLTVALFVLNIVQSTQCTSKDFYSINVIDKLNQLMQICTVAKEAVDDILSKGSSCNDVQPEIRGLKNSQSQLGG